MASGDPRYDDATREVLGRSETHLGETTLVQLTSGRPEAARELEALVTAAGGAYVDGAVLAYPSAVGTEQNKAFWS